MQALYAQSAADQAGPAHRYTLADFGLTAEEVEEASAATCRPAPAADRAPRPPGHSVPATARRPSHLPGRSRRHPQPLPSGVRKIARSFFRACCGKNSALIWMAAGCWCRVMVTRPLRLVLPASGEAGGHCVTTDACGAQEDRRAGRIAPSGCGSARAAGLGLRSGHVLEDQLSPHRAAMIAMTTGRR